MGYLSNPPPGGGQWVGSALGQGSAGLGVPLGQSGGNSALAQLLGLLNPQQPAPTSITSFSGKGPNTRAPTASRMWWDAPGAGSMGTTEAPPLSPYPNNNWGRL